MSSPRTQKKVALVYRREIRMVDRLEGVRVRAPIPERLYRTLLAHGVEDGGDVTRWKAASELGR